MNFKLCLVGHLYHINELETVIYQNFFNIEVYKIIFNTDMDIDKAIDEIKKNILYYDAILYTGIEPFLLVSQEIDSTIVSSYVSIKKQDLIHCLFKAKFKDDYNIYDISIDSIDQDTIVETYKSLSLNIENMNIHVVDINTKEHNFVLKAEKEHTSNYINNLSSICITSITEIYNNLIKKSIPSALLMPSMDNYLYEIKNLMLSNSLKRTEKSETVIIFVMLSQNSEFHILNNNQFKEMMEISVSAQYMAIFCQKLDGALYTINNNNYVIICNSKKLELITEKFKKIELLEQIARETRFTVNIGIGYGDTLAVARKHSIIACNKSILHAANSAFIVYDQKNVIGPIENNLIKPINEKMYREGLIEISNNSKLSINTVYKIDCIIKQLNKRKFTANELALELGVTTRTANRIILKLEDAKYLSEIGKHIIGSKGRPSRVIKILF